MRVLIFGGRDFSDRNMMQRALDDFYLANGAVTYIIQGCATGADSMGAMLAREWLNIPESGEQFKADWKNINVVDAVVKSNRHGQYNAVAGHQRNERMITEGKPDWGMCFPGGSGMSDMKKRLIKAGIPVWDAVR